MIVRCYFSCETCGHHHTLRISVGANAYQQHNFACRHCGESIVVGMNVDYENLSTQPVPVRNCVPSDQEGSIVTLNPEMVIPDELQGKDFAFPFLHEMSRIREEDPTFDADMEKTSRPAKEAMAEWEKGGRLPPAEAEQGSGGLETAPARVGDFGNVRRRPRRGSGRSSAGGSRGP